MESSFPTAMERTLVLDEIRSSRDRGVAPRQLARTLAGRRGNPLESGVVEAAIAELARRGDIVEGDDGRLRAVEYTDYWVGTMRVTSRGFGILRQDEPGQEDLVVPPEAMRGALDGDRVLVHRPVRRRKGKPVPSRYAEVTAVLSRRRETIVGRYRVDGSGAWIDPFARRLHLRVVVDDVPGDAPRDGEYVEVALLDEVDGGVARGRIVRRFGMAGEPGVDEEVILAELAIPVAFPVPALQEADALPDRVQAADIEGRTDLRDQPAVTIDGATAKDFDDAVVAFEGPDGAVEVFVHIADVSHYVTPGTAIDRAARERGTSVYLPGRAIPMLPEKLSNRLCSLVPDEDRLAFTVRFLVLPDGGVEGYRAESSVFRSRRRCTYEQVFGWLEDGSWPADMGDDVRTSLRLLDEAAQRLRRRRRDRGAIDFDLPEPEILLDPEGFMTGVAAAPRNRAHRLIEELMIAANECVARMLVWGRQPGIFRVHERPSSGRLAELSLVLEEFGIALKGDLEDLPPGELQRVLDEVEGRPEERFLHTLILRALARAVYHSECRGHYALATEFYLHFTSPIRRYPDLVVHRFLRDLVANRRLSKTETEAVVAELSDLAQQCSFTERRAEQAERDVVQWKQAEFMRERIGERFHGHVTGVVAFGLFVQLDEVYVEGMVHVSSMRDDYYRYDELGHRLVGERGGRVFRLGDPVEVRVSAIDEEHMEVELEIVGGGASRRKDGAADGRKAGTSRPAHRPPKTSSRRPGRKERGRGRGRR